MALRSILTVIAAAGYALLLADGVGWWPVLWSLITGIDHVLLPPYMPMKVWGWTLGLTILAIALRLLPGREKNGQRH